MDGAHAVELLFILAISRDIHALFLRQISNSDPTALPVVIADQAGFHLPQDDGRLPANLRLLPLPPLQPRAQSRRSASAACSKPPTPTGSTRRCAALKIISQPRCALGPPRPQSPPLSTPGSPIR